MLKTTWCSGQTTRTTPAHPPAHTRFCLQPFQLWHCSLPWWQPPLHLGRSQAFYWAPAPVLGATAPPLAKAKTAIKLRRSQAPPGLLFQPLRFWHCPQPRQQPPSCLGEAELDPDCASSSWDLGPTPWQSSEHHWAWEKPQLSSVSHFSPSGSSHTPNQGGSRQRNPGEKQPTLTSDPALPPKPLSTHRLYRDAPTQGHAFKTVIGYCFT